MALDKFNFIKLKLSRELQPLLVDSYSPSLDVHSVYMLYITIFLHGLLLCI